MALKPTKIDSKLQTKKDQIFHNGDFCELWKGLRTRRSESLPSLGLRNTDWIRPTAVGKNLLELWCNSDEAS